MVATTTKGYVYRKLPFVLNIAILAQKTNYHDIKKSNPTLYEQICRVIRHKINQKECSSIDSILLLAYPIMEDGTLDTSTTWGCICVNPKYTIYEKVHGGPEEYFVVEDGSFNILTNERERKSFVKHCFDSETYAVNFCKEFGSYEKDGSRKAGGAEKELYDNHHTFLDEFVEMSSYAGNYCINHPNVQSNILNENGDIVCKTCAKNVKDATLFTDNNVLDFSKLSCNVKADILSKKSPFRFTNEIWVDKEFLYYGETKDLPYIPKLTHEYDVQFLSRYRHTCYDIETVVRKVENRSGSSSLSSTDEIVAISYVTYEGTGKMLKSIYFTSKKPNFDGVEEQYFANDCPADFVDVPIDQERLLTLMKGHVEFVNGNKIRTELRLCKDQGDIVEQFVQMLEKDRPVVLSHFNGLSFDSKYIVRAYLNDKLKSCSKEDREKALFKFDLRKRLSPLNLLNYSYGMIKSKVKPNYKGFRSLMTGQKKEHGMIDDNVFEMTYIDFESVIQCDVMLATTDGGVESLDNLCSSKLKVNKVDLPHTKIAEKFDQGDPILLKYAMMDTFLTVMLYISDSKCFDLFVQQQKILGTPWDLSISSKQSHQTKLLRYKYERWRDVKSVASIRPKASFAYVVYAKNIAHFFLSGFDESVLPDDDWGMTKQLAKDFTNGNCKTNTCLSKMPWKFENKECVEDVEDNDDDDDDELVTIPSFSSPPTSPKTSGTSETFTFADVTRSFALFQTQNKSSYAAFTTTHLMSFLWWLILPRDTSTILKPFRFYREEFSKQYGREYIRQLDDFLIYLVTVRQNLHSLSPFEELKNVLKQFRKHHKTYTKGEFGWLESFAEKYFFTVESTESHHLLPQKTINLEFLKLVNSTVVRYRQHSDPFVDTENVSSRIIDFIRSKTSCLEISNLSFAGAFLVPACTGMAPTPTSIIDVESEYPNALLGSNLDNGCVVSVDEILEAGERIKEDEHYRVFNTKRCDDFKSWKCFLPDFMDYLRQHYIFVLHQSKWTSSIGKALTRIMTDRFADKRKAEDYYELYEACSDENKKKELLEKVDFFTNQSVAKKRSLNSIYGNIQYLTKSSYRSVVTSIGRMTTQSMIRECRRLFKERCLIVYGDTDSIMVSLLLSNDVILLEDPSVVANLLDEDGCVLDSDAVVKAREFGMTFARKKNVTDDPYIVRVKMQECLFNDYIIPYLNKRLPLPPHMRIGKTKETFSPFLIPSAKMYCGLNPTDNYSFFTKGMSLKNKNSPGIKKDILRKLMMTIKKHDSDVDNLAHILCEMYHYIGKEIIGVLRTDEKYLFDKVSVKLSINKSKLLENSKKHELLMRLRKEGDESAFESEKLRVVPVMPMGADKNWSLATIHQITRDELSLNTEKILLDNTTELFTVLNAMVECTSGVIDVFGALINRVYHESVDSKTFEKFIITKPAGMSSRDFRISDEYKKKASGNSVKVSYSQIVREKPPKESSQMLRWLNASDEYTRNTLLNSSKRKCEKRLATANKRMKKSSCSKNQSTLDSFFKNATS